MIATAGHVDHGKSTLVRVLTGTDPDRFREEKERGLTIDLGFAGLDLPSGRGVAFIDVPGHVRFLKNMLAGVGAVDACVFVVAATEGWKPQSEEHLRILELLGLEHGMVALTKVGLADDDLRELAHLEVEEQVAGTFLQGAPVVEVDALDGTGVDALVAALDDLTASTPTAVDHDRPRLWIDRSFAPAGAGTVVTGTLTGGSVHVDDEVVIGPDRRPARIRGLQRLGEQVASIEPGNRTAVNLSGIDHDDIRRGDALVRANQWFFTTSVDCEIRVLDTLGRPLSRRGAHRAYLGSGEHPVSLRVLGPDAIEPGDTGMIRLHLDEPVPLVMGDRFVLRDAGPGMTVGGGAVLDVDPVRKAAKAAPDRDIDRIVRERGWTTVADLERLTGTRRAPDLGDWVVDPEARDVLVEEVTAAIADAGSIGLDIAQLDDRARAVVGTLHGVIVDQGRVREADADDLFAGHPLLAALEGAKFAPPSAAEVGTDPAEVRELVKHGLVIESDGVLFAPSAVDEAAERLRRALDEQPTGLTIAEVRDLLDTSRKYVLALMGHFDSTGRTRRRDDVRIAGPRL
ncbi:MAG TPA: selenocysteine-specific translation elongation factor [Acidimicrobiales bacterium]|nr:selenocysteine-specific translation elongation factor [Acidimicrobiales bacterium]